jgi:hypothetical protein
MEACKRGTSQLRGKRARKRRKREREAQARGKEAEGMERGGGKDCIGHQRASASPASPDHAMG